MHDLIPNDALDNLTDFELFELEVRLRHLILTPDLREPDLRFCLVMLSSVIRVRQMRCQHVQSL